MIEFSINVQPCIPVSLNVLDQVDSFTYNLGQIGITSSAYSFVTDPDCGYDLTYQVLDLPSFVTHLAASRNFQLDATSDVGLLGDYTVTVNAEVEYFIDETETVTDVLLASQSFTITVQPCQIFDYSPSIQATQITYAIGEASFTGNSYAFG